MWPVDGGRRERRVLLPDADGRKHVKRFVADDDTRAAGARAARGHRCSILAAVPGAALAPTSIIARAASRRLLRDVTLPQAEVDRIVA
jgi:hypothetical protein